MLITGRQLEHWHTGSMTRRAKVLDAIEPMATASMCGADLKALSVEAGDIILRFNGKAIEKAVDLPRIVGEIKPGSKATLSVWRKGATKELALTVGEVEADKVAAKTNAGEGKFKGSAQGFGLTVSELSDAQKKELKVKGGVRIEAASEGAARAGLREGDVILAANNTDIASVKDLEAVLAKHDKAKPLHVLYRRGEWSQFAVIRPLN